MNKYKISNYSFSYRYGANSNYVNLLFSGRTAKLIQVNDSTYDALVNGKLGELTQTAFNTLFENKYIIPFDEDELYAINSENAALFEKQHTDVLYLSIQPTSFCQFNCVYCGQEHTPHNLRSDVIDTILARIEYKLSNTKADKLEIGWFGGEPLCAMPQMRTLNSKIKRLCKKYDKEYISHLTTNGYLLNLNTYNELVNEFNVRGIEITLDGDKYYHDKRRFLSNGKGTFEIIYSNILSIIKSSCFHEKTCRLSIRCNIDLQNIDGLLPLIYQLSKDSLQDIIIFYFTEVVSWAKNGAGLNEADKQLMSGKVIEILYNLLTLGFSCPILPTRIPPKHCMASSSESEMYDTFGNVFDCSEISYSEIYQGSELHLGKLSNNNIPNVFERSVLNTYKDRLLDGIYKPCNKCKFYPVCGGGCPKGLHEGEPRCPSFIYNIKERMLLEYLRINQLIGKVNQ